MSLFLLFYLFIIVVVVVVDVNIIKGIDNSYCNSKYMLAAGRANARKASF